MKRLSVCCAAAVLLALPPTARADKDAGQPGQPDRLAMRELARGNTRFAVALYGRLRDREGNLFFSPYSVSTALAMTSAGARGKTLSQMETVLHLPEQKRLHPAAGHLMAQMNKGGRGYQLTVANALWGQSDYRFRREFLSLLDKQYDAGLRTVDFKTSTEQARRTINGWVEKQTRDKIKDLLPKGVLNVQTKLVLTNAVYFQGDWKAQFRKAATREEDFHVSPRVRVKVPLMSQRGSFGYAQTRDVQVLELPYAGDDLSMVVLLPRQPAGLAALEKDLTAEQLQKYIASVRAQRVDVHLPRFQATSQFSLKDALSALGMRDVFTPAVADLSGMDGTRELFIRDVIHKAFVDVNEKGTEAAAATAVVVEATAAPVNVPTFRADRPFLFLIRDRRTDNVLFLGRLVNPKN